MLYVHLRNSEGESQEREEKEGKEVMGSREKKGAKGGKWQNEKEKKNNTAFSKSVWVDNKLQCLILYKTLFEYNRDDTKESDMTEAI